MGQAMISQQRPNRFSGVSLAPPETMQANFGVSPPMSAPVPQMDTGDPYAGLRTAGQQFAQGRAEKQLQGHMQQATDRFVGRNQPLSTPEGASGMTLSRPPARQRFAGSLDTLKSALKGVF